MRSSCTRVVIAVVAAVAFANVVRAEPEEGPPTVSVARLNEQYAIPPGMESLFSEMLGHGQTLPGGCTFASGQIEQTVVIASYTCGAETVVLQLLHPKLAPPEAKRTEQFAITVQSGTPPAGFIDAVAERIRAHEDDFDWTELHGSNVAMRWLVPVAGGVVVAILLFWAFRRLTRRAKTD